MAFSALLYALAFPPLALWPLAWIALVPLLAALVRVGPGGGFLLGWLWSLLAGLGASSWLPRMISDYFAVGTAAAWFAAAAATLATGIFYGVFGAWIAWLARRRPLSPLLVAAVWGSCEYARTLAPLANPWMLSGYGQVPFASFAQSADAIGVVGLGMLIAAANAAIAGLVDARIALPRPRRAALCTAAVLAVVLGYGALRLGEAFGEPSEVRVALVQSATPRERRFAPSERSRNLADHVDLATRAARGRPDLILLAELAVDVPFDGASREARALGRIAKASGVDVLTGAPSVFGSASALQQFNSYFVLHDGALADRYDKVALTPFSETNPLARWIDVASAVYTPGRTPRPLQSTAGPVGVLLCGEAMFGPAARALVRAGAELLANPANDSWFANGGAARMQLDIAALRAIETRRWLLRPTLSGYTAAIDPHGRIAAIAPLSRPEILEARVRRSRADTFYLRHGDVVAQGAVVAALLWTAALGVTGGRVHPRSGS
jgi:apolipoprotein N-acyltransferase